MATRSDQAAWSAHVATLHPVAEVLHARHGPLRLHSAPAPADRFATLVRAVCYQQLAGAAAGAIWSRVVEAAGGEVTPAALLALGPDALRACGLSGAKAATFLALSEAVEQGDVRLESTGRMSDEAVVEMLTTVRGIGRWTAEMFLLSTLHRPDVWPTADLGVRTGFGMAFGLDVAPTAGELEALGEPFRPYRSVIAWWCWREVDDRRAGPR